MIAWMPNYAVFIGLYSLADFLSNLVYSFSLYIATPISEAYNNGKIELTKNYIVRNYKWYSLTGGFMAGLLIAGAPLLGVITGESYSLMVPMLQFLAIFKFIDLFAIIHDSANNGLGHPEYNIVLVGIDQGIRILVLYLLLVVFPSGWFALVWSLGFGRLIKWIVGYLIHYFKFFKFKVNWWQTFVATFIAMGAEFLVIQGLILLIFPLLGYILGELIAAVLVIVCAIFIGPFLVYIPVHAIAGGWDDNSLYIFQKAVGMSGPSKPIAIFLMKLVKIGARMSPLHGRFPISVTGIQEEIDDLTSTRKKKLIEEGRPRK
jgi:O-antigen/teichoic acid export membrane protein